MPRYKLIVMSNPVDGCDDEFNRWYDDVHLVDVFKVEGVIGAERYRLRGAGKWRYLAIYELECDDPAAVEKELGRRAGSEAMVISDSFDMASVFMATAEMITPYRAA